MANTQAQQAARNNALWCDAICRAHGKPGEFTAGMWINRQETPPYYPNAVTLESGGTAAQIACINELGAAGIPGEWAVKDSFCALDLAPSGFRILFEAEWIYRPPALLKPAFNVPEVHWAQIDEEAALASWELAWSGESNGDFTSIFRPALLQDETVAVIAAYRAQRIVAGVIANRTDDVVGLSNVFVPTENSEAFWAGCVAAVIDAFPGLPVVGYEGGQELATAQNLGFNSIGALRIWAQTDS